MARSDRVVHAWAILSTGGSKTYEVLLYDDGRLTCECAAWIYQKGRTVELRQCKHTRSVQAEAEKIRAGAVPVPVPPPPLKPVSAWTDTVESVRARDHRPPPAPPPPKKKPTKGRFRNLEF